MKLSLKDRVVFESLLPAQGRFEDLIVAEDIIAKVKITQKEIVKYGIKQNDNGGLGWEPNEDVFDVEFTELEKALMSRQLQKFSEEKTLHKDHLNLYKLFAS